jgi:hypothetical protein
MYTNSMVSFLYPSSLVLLFFVPTPFSSAGLQEASPLVTESNMAKPID